MAERQANNKRGSTGPKRVLLAVQTVRQRLSEAQGRARAGRPRYTFIPALVDKEEDGEAAASPSRASEEGGGAEGGEASGAGTLSPAGRQAAIWQRLKRKYPGSLWAPAAKRTAADT